MSDINALRHIMDLQYQRAQTDLGKIVERENALRAKLTKLDRQEALAQTHEPGNAPMRTIGADIVWLGWLGRMREALNTELAMLLAQKEGHLARVRKAHGKSLMAQRLGEQETKRQAAMRQAKALQRAIDQSMW